MEQVRDDLRRAANLDILDAYQFAIDREDIALSNQLREYTAPSFAPGTPVLAGAIDLMHRIYEDFAYDSTATTVSTPMHEVMEHRRGVCQDFAHVQIGCLRSLGLAARYVSGYIVPLAPGAEVEYVGAQASHAWLSVYAPGHGWVDLDPTNNMLPSTEHVTLGWGRDYEEVSPVRGVILGGGSQLLGVDVSVERLDFG
jgi:transglutaminase-like putative cysteine protease